MTDHTSTPSSITRRTLLAATGAAGLAVMTGCTTAANPVGTGPASESGGTPAPTPTGPSPDELRAAAAELRLAVTVGEDEHIADDPASWVTDDGGVDTAAVAEWTGGIAENASIEPAAELVARETVVVEGEPGRTVASTDEVVSQLETALLELRDVSVPLTVEEAPAPSEPIGTLALGEEGDLVALLQELLVDAGYEADVDGVFGRGTFQAVADLQYSNDLDEDGIAGPATWAVVASGDAAPPAPRPEKWIEVNLTDHTVTAFEDDAAVFGPTLIVDGDGDDGSPSDEGTFHTYLKYEQQDMTNASRYPEDHPDYYFNEDVPWVMYYNRGEGFHGAPWRDSFGYSGSHGCINMRVEEAEWLWHWAPLGTRVEVRA